MAKKANGDKSVQWSDISMALSGGDGRADGGRGDAKVARPIFFSQIFSISPIFHARSKAIAIDLFTFSAVVGPLPPSLRFAPSPSLMMNASIFVSQLVRQAGPGRDGGGGQSTTH